MTNDYRFIVGTGRCGSTLLSRMLDQHSDVVCLHEFFTGLDWGARFQPGDVPTDELIRFLTDEQMVTTEVLARGYTTEEICYPFDSPGARRQQGDKLPWLLVSMLSRLSQEPDELFDRFVKQLECTPPQPLSRTYPQLFDWLAREAGGKIWIERSGSSVDYLSELASMFPGARFLHIHRDGHEAALSIRAHPFYRLGVSLLMNLFPEGLDEAAMIDYALATPPPLEAVGKYWSDQVTNGLDAAQNMASGQYRELSFESLLTDPVTCLYEIQEFFELADDPEFAKRGASLSRGLPPSRFDKLTPAEQQTLQGACETAMKKLNQQTT
jgi:putative sulfotransferase